MRRLISFMSAAAIVACLAVTPAFADAQNQVVSDCASNGHLTRTYSAAQLRAALTSMPVTVKEYTSCYDIIQAALLKEIGQNGKGNGSGGSGSGGSSFPTVLVIILVLLALAAVTFGALAIRRRGATAGGGGSGGTAGGSGGTEGGDGQSP